MDPEELQSSEENERARRAREIAQAGFFAHRQGMSMPDEVPYMLAAPQAPAEPVEVFTNDVWPPVAPPAQQQVPSTPSEVVRNLDIPRVQPRQAAPAGPQAATGAPVPAGVVNLGPSAGGEQQAPAAPAQGVGIIPPETFANPLLPQAERDFQYAEQELLRRGVYTGVPTRTVRTVTTPGAVDPETARSLSMSDLDRRAALKFRAAQQAEGLGQQGGIFEQADVESQLEAQRQQQAAEDQARTMRWQTERADNINQQVLSGRIDPNRVLGDSFSGGRIAAALGLFISGLAQGEQGANSFLQIINQTIDRDIAAQMANMDNLRAGAQNQQNLVGMYRTVFGDETAAREAARATMLQSVAQKLQAQQARMAQAGQQPALMLALAELDAAQASAAAAAQQAQDTTVRTMTQRTGGVVGGRNIPAARAFTQLGQAREQAGARGVEGVREGIETVGQLQQRANPSANPELVVRYGEKRFASLGAEQALRRIRELMRSGQQAGDIPGVGAIDRVRPGWLQSEDGRKMQAELGNLRALYLKATTGAVANAMEQENADNLVRGLTEGDLTDRVNRFEELILDQRQSLDAAYPPEVVQTFLTRLGPPRPQPLPVQGRQQR